MPEISAVAKVENFFVKGAEGAKKVVESIDCLAAMSELIQSILSALRVDPTVPLDSLSHSDQVKVKVLRSAEAFSGVVIITSIINDVLQFIIRKKGEYLLQRDGLEFSQRVIKTLYHSMDLVAWLKTLKLIVEESKAFEVIAALNLMLKAASNGIDILMSAKMIQKSAADIEKFNKRIIKWKERSALEKDGWLDLAATRIAHFEHEKTKRMKNLKTDNPNKNEVRIAAKDKEYKHLDKKFNDWTNVRKGLEIDYKGAYLASLKRVCINPAEKGGKVYAYEAAIKNRHHVITKEAISITLCALTILSVAAAIGLQAAGIDASLGVGLGSLGIAVVALTIATNTFDLADNILDLFIDRVKPKKISLPAPFVDDLIEEGRLKEAEKHRPRDDDQRAAELQLEQSRAAAQQQLQQEADRRAAAQGSAPAPVVVLPVVNQTDVVPAAADQGTVPTVEDPATQVDPQKGAA